MFTAIFLILFIIAASIAGLLGALYVSKSREFDVNFERFQNVIDIEKETKKCAKKNAELRDNYNRNRAVYEKLMREISILEEHTEDLSFGLYEPHFNFDTPERYKIEIEKIRTKQKEMIRGKIAAQCSKEWEMAGSKKEGKRMTDRTIKLMLRAFNNECDAAVLKVRWNNVVRMRERITKAYEAINKLEESIAIAINPSYLELKLAEISLAHEYQERLQAQKEEQRRMREQMREEERVRREIEKALEESAREERTYKEALEKAREEMGTAQGEKLEKLKAKMALLETQLQEAEEKGKRARSMAEQTKAGHVYIISNIGSFGKNIYKIGLTRRLDPEIRVRELGDASVPFAFDIHAMIYSEDAPDLETKFHKHFRNKQVNLVNPRKEFFTVTLDEIEDCARLHGLSVELTKLAEAKEYRETVAKRAVIENIPSPKADVAEFPQSLRVN